MIKYLFLLSLFLKDVCDSDALEVALDCVQEHWGQRVYFHLVLAIKP